MSSGVSNIYQSQEYRRSRKAYIAESTFEYLVSILVTDAFLAKVLTYMGMDDVTIGVISSLTSFAFLFQLLSLYVMRHLRNTKRTVILFKMFSQILFLSVYLIPFLPFGITVKTGVVVSCILIAYLGLYTVSSLSFRWGNSYVAPDKRGEYSAGKEIVSLISGIVFTLVTGRMIDHYEAKGNMQIAFLLVAILMLVLNICDFISLLLIKNESGVKETSHRVGMRDVLKNTFGNKSYVYIVVMFVLWDIGQYMTLGFLGTYKTTDLLLSVGAVQVINMAANLLRMVVSKPFGRYSDRTSYATGCRMAMLLAAGSFGVLIFCTPKHWWLIIISTILFNVSMAGINQNSWNMMYNYVPETYLVQALAIKQSVAGVMGFAASLAGGAILQHVQQNGNTFLGIPMYGQQVLAAISVVFVMGAVVLSKLVVEKQKRIC